MARRSGGLCGSTGSPSTVGVINHAPASQASPQKARSLARAKQYLHRRDVGAVGVAMMWFLAYGMQMSTAPETEVESSPRSSASGRER
jgi:hypothetical protein